MFSYLANQPNDLRPGQRRDVRLSVSRITIMSMNTYVRYSEKVSVKTIHLQQPRKGHGKSDELEHVECHDGENEHHVRDRSTKREYYSRSD